jgi:hypothetical protein
MIFGSGSNLIEREKYRDGGREHEGGTSHPRERAQVLNDVYMLDLGAYAYIPLVTNYTIETDGYTSS